MLHNKTKTKTKQLKAIIMSGGTGRTGKQVVEAALAQFDDPDVEVVIRDHVNTAAAAEKIVRQAKREGSIICHTLVAPEVRQALARETEMRLVPTVDILGPVVTALSDQLQTQPRHQPGLSYQLNKEQFDRIDAVDFSLAHDDGRRPEDYDQADVILVGLSRVSKSVTCLCLAFRGIRAANVAVAPEFGPPDELLEIDPQKVIALQMNVRRLQQLREARGARWGDAMQYYADPRRIAEEVKAFNHLVTKHGWRCIDVSYKAVEDVAAEVAKMVGYEDFVSL
jgi:regulator of PEP synthase PpsR (kinase-PPPase family)